MKLLKEQSLILLAVMFGCIMAQAEENPAGAPKPDKLKLRPIPWFSELKAEVVREIKRIQEISLRPMHLDGTKRGPHYTEVPREERKKRLRYLNRDPTGKKERAKIIQSADKALARQGGDPESVIWAYILTGEQKYYDNWRDHLIAEANRLDALYPTALEMAQKIGPGNQFIWGRTKAPLSRWITAYWYDLLAGYLSDEDERRFRWQLKKTCDALRVWKVDSTNIRGQSEGGNMAAMTIGNSSPMWCAIGYEDMINWSISHYPLMLARDLGGMLQLIRNLRDGHIWGEAHVYQWYVGSGFANIAERSARYDGRDIWNMTSSTGTKPLNLVNAMVSMAFPLEQTGFGLGSIRISNYGEDATSMWRDQWLNYGAPDRNCWNRIIGVVYKASKDKGYGWLSNVHRGKNGMPREAKPPPAPCTLYPTAGMAMLRADESPGYWTGRGLAMQVMGGEPRRSAPGDSFSIRLHGAGRLLYPDWPMVTYEVYTVGGWERAGIRRNSAMIDGRETWRHRTFWRNGYWPEVKYLALRANRYGHDTSERAFMMTKEYLLDVFDMVVRDKLNPERAYYGDPAKAIQYAGWSGAGLWDENGRMPDSHTFDYILHGIGQQFPSNWWRFSPSRELATENWPNRWFTNERRADIGEAGFYVDWKQRSGGMEGRRGLYRKLGREWFEDHAEVRMHLLGSPGTVAYTLEAPMGMEPGHVSDLLPRLNVVNSDEHPEMTIKTLVVRRRGKAAQFAAVHEAYRDSPAIQRVEYLHRPTFSNSFRTVGIKVTGPTYVDRLYLTLGLHGKFKDAGNGVAEVKDGKREIRNFTLNWLFKKDPDKVGDVQKWYDPVHNRGDWRKVNAGVNWQEFEKGYYGTAWYAKALEPVKLPANRKAYLLFEGVDEDCWFYLNGNKIYERLPDSFGDSWNKPILIDVTETLKPGKTHLLVVKVRKIKFQTGIYSPVRLMVEDPKRVPKPDPIVTVSSQSDPNERIIFKGQAYLRDSGRQFLARGDIVGFCIESAKAKKLILNGKRARLKRSGGYALYGKVEEPTQRRISKTQASNPPRDGKVEPAPLLKPVEIRFPQNYVNIDAVAGGPMVVRLINRSQQVTSGTVAIKPSSGLQADQTERTFQNLPPEHRIDLGFTLKPNGAKAGSLVPVEVTVETPAARGKMSQRVSTRAAVGIVIEEVPATYHIPFYDYSGDMPGHLKPQKDWQVEKFDYIQVRAPNYTIRFDKYSGGSRWIMDATGQIRTSLAGYPSLLTRVTEDKVGTVDYRLRETLTGGWLDEAKYQGVSRDNDGNPNLKFSSLDAKKTWNYVLTPSRAGNAKPGSIDVPGIANPNGLGFEILKRPWWQEKPVSIWPKYDLEPLPDKDANPKKESKNLLIGKPTLNIPPEARAAGGIYLDDQQTPDGNPSICFELEKLRALAGTDDFQITIRWPVHVTQDKRYRLTIMMRHANVKGISVGEWLYTNSSVGHNWSGNQLGNAAFWPRPVREWSLVYSGIKAARSGATMSLSIRIPCRPGQSGKAWLGGFMLQEVE